MASDNYNEEAAGSAIAAFTLAKMAFWHLLQQGLLEKSEAQRMLRRAIGARGETGPNKRLRQKNWLQCCGALKPTSRRSGARRKKGAHRPGAFL
jgi:hypothetical protein